MVLFANRRAGGRELATLLRALASDDTVVLGLPRGGVPVAFEIARELNAPLDVLVVRKLGAPGFPELAMGAIASGGVRVLNEDVIESLRVSAEALAATTEREKQELERRERAYRGDRPMLDVAGKLVIVADDGLATGATMRAAVRSLRARGAREVVVAVPVGAPESCEELGREAGRCVCAEQPEPFEGVGKWYRDFRPTSDDEVRTLLEEVWGRARLD